MLYILSGHEYHNPPQLSTLLEWRSHAYLLTSAPGSHICHLCQSGHETVEDLDSAPAKLINQLNLPRTDMSEQLAQCK